jgi:hypothetical protein
MRVRKIVGVVICAMPAFAVSEDLPFEAATGLWQVTWDEGSTGYMCVDVRYPPWELKDPSGIDLIDCLVTDQERLDTSGNRLRMRTWKMERQLREGKTHRLETTCVTETFNYGKSQSPTVVWKIEAKAEWTGDLRRALQFTEVAKRTTAGVEVEEGRVSYRLNWLGECPAVLPAGNKCRVPTPGSPATSEWPACDSALRDKPSP